MSRDATDGRNGIRRDDDVCVRACARVESF